MIIFSSVRGEDLSGEMNVTPALTLLGFIDQASVLPLHSVLLEPQGFPGESVALVLP